VFGFVSTQESDWINQIVDTVESNVTKIRSATTDRLVMVTRIFLYALMGFGVVLVMMLLLTIAMVRLFVNMVPFDDDAWLAYFLVGGLLFFVGWFFGWRNRRAR
jgi:hypothetical protein